MKNKKKSIKLRLKILLIVLGISIALLSMETVLSVCSYFMQHIYRAKGQEAQYQAIKILCFGDSFTYGIGAKAKFSYPVQMQEILNQQKNGKKFNIINLGVPGSNSTQVLKKLKKAVSDLKPEAVIIMCGGNDTWNFDDSNIRLDRKLFQFLMGRLRISKFFSVILQNLKLKSAQINSKEKYNHFARLKLAQVQTVPILIRYANIYRDFGYYGLAKRFYYKAIMIDGNDDLSVLELIRCYKLNREYAKALNRLTVALNKNPEARIWHQELEDVFMRMDIIEKTVLFYEKFLLKFPKNNMAKKFLSQAYIRMAGDLYMDNFFIESRAYYLKALKLDPKSRDCIELAIEMVDKNAKLRRDYFQDKLRGRNSIFKIANLYFANVLMKESNVSEILSANLKEMVESCERNNIRLFFSGYPDGVSSEIMEVAFRYKIEIIRHEERFVQLLRHRPYKYYFVSEEDRHCTKHGYRIIAENIAAIIMEYFHDYGAGNAN